MGSEMCIRDRAKRSTIFRRLNDISSSVQKIVDLSVLGPCPAAEVCRARGPQEADRLSAMAAKLMDGGQIKTPSVNLTAMAAKLRRADGRSGGTGHGGRQHGSCGSGRHTSGAGCITTCGGSSRLPNLDRCTHSRPRFPAPRLR